MTNISLIDIRRKLPHGAIVRIAERCGVDARIISEVLNRGWHPKLRNKVINYSLDEIESMYPDEKVVERLKIVELDKEDVFAIPQRKVKKAGKKSNSALTYEELDAECDRIQDMIDEAEDDEDEVERLEDLLQDTEDKRDSLPAPRFVFSFQNIGFFMLVFIVVIYFIAPDWTNRMLSSIGIGKKKV